MAVATFTTSINGLTVTLTDTGTVPQNSPIASVNAAWGDGLSSSLDPGGTAHHTYSKAGTYKITETVVDATLQQFSTSESVTVTAPVTGGSGGGGGGGGNGGTPTSPPAASSGNYSVVSQRQTVQQLSSGNVVDVEAVGFQTTPHNVYCEVLVPLNDWQNGNSATYINPVATSIETIMSGQPVSSGSFTQDVDPATNLLADYVSFIVYVQPQGAISAMTATVRVLVSDLAAGAAGVPTAQIQAAAASLQATAGL